MTPGVVTEVFPDHNIATYVRRQLPGPVLCDGRFKTVLEVFHVDIYLLVVDRIALVSPDNSVSAYGGAPLVSGIDANFVSAICAISTIFKILGGPRDLDKDGIGIGYFSFGCFSPNADVA